MELDSEAYIRSVIFSADMLYFYNAERDVYVLRCYEDTKEGLLELSDAGHSNGRLARTRWTPRLPEPCSLTSRLLGVTHQPTGQ